VRYAGEARDYANKSTAHAAQAVRAADAATQAVAEAVDVEQAAREAELAALEEEKLQALDDARLLEEIEAEERTRLEAKRLQEEQTEAAARELITQAEQALAADDLPLAATLGRRAAVGQLDSRGGWTREAARFALSGADADVHTWIDTDRVLAQEQDDRETALYTAQISAPAIAEAARRALESDDVEATRLFLTEGAIEAAAEDYRVQLFRILDEDPGSAVRAAALAAVEANTPRALRDFFDNTYPEALQEDDGVATAALLANGGPYTRAYAAVALEGPAWMRRRFVEVVRHKTAQLDEDSAAHIAAIRGAIAAAAKIAEKARQDAALASKAAAEAREAAQEAATWASRATAAARRAEEYADQARANADAAEESAAAAQASADRARAAASTARGAARSANYSANRALDAARAALASSYSAQTSATRARASALAAGQDARTAAAAASDARHIATELRRREVAEAARRAAREAAEQRESDTDPSDSPTHDDVHSAGSDGDEPWYSDAAWWADITNRASIATGFVAAGLGFASVVFPAGAWVTGPLAAGFGYASLALGALSNVFTGIEYGFTSGEFVDSLKGSAVALVAFGAGRAARPLWDNDTVRTISDAGHDLISPIISVFG
jgi:hypothetical protein